MGLPLTTTHIQTVAGRAWQNARQTITDDVMHTIGEDLPEIPGKMDGYSGMGYGYGYGVWDMGMGWAVFHGLRDVLVVAEQRSVLPHFLLVSCDAFAVVFSLLLGEMMSWSFVFWDSLRDLRLPWCFAG